MYKMLLYVCFEFLLAHVDNVQVASATSAASQSPNLVEG